MNSNINQLRWSNCYADLMQSMPPWNHLHFIDKQKSVLTTTYYIFFFINKCENKLIYFFFFKNQAFLPQYNIFLNLYRFNCYHVYSLIIAFTNKCLPTHHSDRDISVINKTKNKKGIKQRLFSNDILIMINFWDRNPNYDTMINISLFTNKLMSSSKRRNIFY